MANETDIWHLALPGHDRDCVRAMWSQVNAGCPLDTVQVRHLLAIGYRAGSESMQEQWIKHELRKLDDAERFMSSLTWWRRLLLRLGGA